MVLLVWCVSILIQMRRQSRVNVVVLLLAASMSLCIYGCGGSAGSIVVQSADSSEERSADMDAMQYGANAAKEAESMEPAFAPADAPRERFSQDSSGGDRIDEDAGFVADAATFTSVASNLLNFQNDSREISKQELQRLLSTRGIDAETLADQMLDELRFPVREYAHRHKSSVSDVREDFAETLYWQPLMITDADGQVTIRFDLSDSVTTFRLEVDGHSPGGRIGSGGGMITSRLPFQVEPKYPLEVTTGDRVELPVAVINTTDKDSKVSLSINTSPSLRVRDSQTRSIDLSAEERRREHLSLDVLAGSAEDVATVEIRATGFGQLSDKVRRGIRIAPAGYPSRSSIAGQLNDHATVGLPIPKDLIPGSLAVTVRAYPSPLADIMSGVESILREPHGCFEQASATNYPNAMALIYLRESQQANPEVSRRALGMLKRGYQKLQSFECENLGYEWFGTDPGHEALSAFGLMQFTDMSKVMDVKDEILVRTRKWLLGRRDGKGGFRRNPRHLHVWSVEQTLVNAYVLWAITEADVAAGQPLRAAGELALELDELNRRASQSNDPYLVALSAAALMNVKRTEDGESLLQKLSDLQKSDGSLQGRTTVVSSGGFSLKMETTALGTLAWVKSPRFIPQARKAAKWIAGNRMGTAGFGSTQATVLALKALVAMAGHTQVQSGGRLLVQHDGEVIGEARLPDQPESGSVVELTGLGSRLEALRPSNGEIEIELLASGSSQLSYSIEVACHVVTPVSSDDCPTALQVELGGTFSDDAAAAAGDVLNVATRLRNETSRGLPMTVAIVGLPGGLEPSTEQLDQLQQQNKFDYYEIRGREVVFYWRTIEPDAEKQIDFHVTAAIPGKYTGPASRAYLYYTSEQKRWTSPLVVEITP